MPICLYAIFPLAEGLLCGSDGRASACNSGDLGSVPRSGRSPGEGIGYPLPYSWASLVAQMVKRLPAMRETWVRFLGREDPLEKEMAIHSSTLAWKIQWTLAWKSLIGYTVHGVAKSPTRLSNFAQWR